MWTGPPSLQFNTHFLRTVLYTLHCTLYCPTLPRPSSSLITLREAHNFFYAKSRRYKQSVNGEYHAVCTNKKTKAPVDVVAASASRREGMGSEFGEILCPRSYEGTRAWRYQYISTIPSYSTRTSTEVGALYSYTEHEQDGNRTCSYSIKHEETGTACVQLK